MSMAIGRDRPPLTQQEIDRIKASQVYRGAVQHIDTAPKVETEFLLQSNTLDNASANTKGERMNKLTIGLITAGMINCLVIGWAVSGKIEVQEWRTHNENLVYILGELKAIKADQHQNKVLMDWYISTTEQIYKFTKPKTNQ